MAGRPAAPWSSHLGPHGPRGRRRGGPQLCYISSLPPTPGWRLARRLLSLPRRAPGGRAAGGGDGLRPGGGKLSLWEATAIAVGMIIGASIFALVGVGAEVAGRDLPLALVLDSLAAGLVAYSYAKLGARFVSNAGPIEFIIRGLGDGLATGVLAFMLWLTYVLSISMFAKAFAGYLLALLGREPGGLAAGLAEALAIAFFTALDIRGSKTVGRAEGAIVAAKLAVLGLFIAAGIWSVEPGLLAPDLSPRGLRGALYAASVFFLSYTGFGLVTNASEDIEDPERNVPRAIYLSLVIASLVYVLVAVVAVGNLPVEELARARDYALAEAARPFLGSLGFTMVSLGALLSTSSAINASLYGGANIAYALAKKGELPRVFERRSWLSEPEGLYITALLSLAFALGLNLDGVAEVCSATFIAVYMAVIVSHYRLAGETRGSRPLILLSLAVVLALLALLLYYQLASNPRAFYTTVTVYTAVALLEAVYRRATGRRFRAGAQEGQLNSYKHKYWTPGPASAPAAGLEDRSSCGPGSGPPPSGPSSRLPSWQERLQDSHGDGGHYRDNHCDADHAAEHRDGYRDRDKDPGGESHDR
ncbi:APC family permease [Pyrodictium occultum]|uniref:APC family permease n=1 Tax=Pyrodictium occultum TaxID=2309 RepID=UPI00308444E6